MNIAGGRLGSPSFAVLGGLGVARDSSNDEITLGLLSAVEADGEISQRALSSELGVALDPLLPNDAGLRAGAGQEREAQLTQG